MFPCVSDCFHSGCVEFSPSHMCFHSTVYHAVWVKKAEVSDGDR